MRITALKATLAAIVLTTAALSTHAAKAETRLNVPFSFNVAGQTLPAGVYTVQQDSFNNTVVLRNQDASKSFTYALRPGESVSSEAHVALKFEASGENHILRGIQVGSKQTARMDTGTAPLSFEPARLSQGR